jgi:3-methyladenine DNA glycosylase Mpg
MLNVSSEMPGIGAGVLIRALEPARRYPDHAAKSWHRALARLGARTRKACRGVAG